MISSHSRTARLATLGAAAALAVAAAPSPALASSDSAARLAETAGTVVAAPDQTDGLAGTAPYDQGLNTAFCPAGHRTASTQQAQPAATLPGAADATATAANTSEAGWPAKECLKMDKGPAGRRHTLVGLDGVHNWLLGGYGNDTIIGGDRGDVIWGDYHPSGEPRSQTVWIRAGNGRSVIYANDTHNYVWTGTSPYTVVHAHNSGTSGDIHCQSPHIVVYLSTVSERYFHLDGCKRISHYSVGY